MAQLKLQDRINCPVGSVEKCLQGGDGNERFIAKDAVVPAPAGGNSAEERTNRHSCARRHRNRADDKPYRASRSANHYKQK